MPIYKYECNKCGHVFEDLRSFSDPDPDECPECQGAEVRKLISGGNFVLKGSGWYVTDYANSSGGGAAGSESTAAASSASPDTGSSAETSSISSSAKTSDTGSASSDSAASGAKKPSSGDSEVA